MVRKLTRLSMLAGFAGLLAACAVRRAPETAARPAVASRLAPADSPAAAVPAPAVAGGRADCAACGVSSMPAALDSAIEARVAELRARGGVCGEYAAVLANALENGRITVRPYMWRVEGNLASAQAEATGELTIARDIDPLNVGVRKVDDVLRSAEHEAVHLALRIPSGDVVREARVDEQVNACRAEKSR